MEVPDDDDDVMMREKSIIITPITRIMSPASSIYQFWLFF
jgi:hypothetical protein